MEIFLGSKVFCQGGEEAGEVGQIIVDLRTREATDIVVRESPLSPHEKLVALSMIQGNTGRGILLYADATQFRQLPQYLPTGFGAPSTEAGAQRAVGEEGVKPIEATESGR